MELERVKTIKISNCTTRIVIVAVSAVSLYADNFIHSCILYCQPADVRFNASKPPALRVVVDSSDQLVFSLR